MKFLSAFLAILILLPTPARAAAIVEGSVADILGIGVPWARIQFTPLSNPQAESGVIITSQPKTISSTADGLFSVPLEQGDYVVVIAGRDTFQISVPNTTNTYILQDLITTSLAYSYSQTPASGPADWYGAAVVLNGATSNALRSSITALSGSSGSGLTTTSNALRSSISANTASITTTSNVLRSDLTTVSNYALTTINSSSNLLQLQIDGITTSTNTSYSITAASNALRSDITTLQGDLTTTSNALRSGISANTASITSTSNTLRSDLTTVSNYALTSINSSSNLLQLQIDGISGSTNYSAAITTTSNGLRSDITTLQSDLTTTSNALRSGITANTSGITTSSNALQVQIDGISGSTNYANLVTTTSNALRSDITANTSAITTTSNALRPDIAANAAAITTTSNALRSDITANGSLITTSSNALQLQIDAISGGTNYATAITTTSNVLRSDITANTSAITTTSNALRSDIDANGSAITTTSNALRSDISTLQSGLTSTSNGLRSDITANGSAITTTSNVLRGDITRGIVYVSAVSDLVALSPTAWTNAATRGYYSEGDGGGGLYRWSTDQSGTNFGSKIASSVSGSWVLNESGLVNVLQWGVKRDGATSASARIQAALTHAMTNTVRHLVIPPGNYSFTTQVTGAADNLKVDIFGNCKNQNGVGVCLLSFGPSISTTTTNGLMSTPFAATNMIVDGHGIGIVDGNSPNVVGMTFNPTNGVITGGNNAFIVESLKDSIVQNLRVQNGCGYGIYAGYCDGLKIQNCIVINGTARNATRTDNGALMWGTHQDGLHIVDCSRTKVLHNYVEGSDDAIACDSAFLKCGDILISGNTIKQIFRCINPATGLYYTNYFPNSSAVYIGNSDQDSAAMITNVIVSKNQIIGGDNSGGGFSVRNRNTTSRPPENILFEHNTLSGLNDPGDPSIAPNGVGHSIHLNTGKNIVFRGNHFHQCNRSMAMSSLWPKSSGLVFEGNSFYDSPISAGNSINAYLPHGIINVDYAEDVTIRNNTFINVFGMPIRVGALYNTNAVYRAIISGNKIINANLRYASSNSWSGGAPTNNAQAIYVSGCPDYIIENNLISTNSAGGIRVDYSVGRGIIRNNTIEKLGVAGMTADAECHGLYVVNVPANTSISTEVSGNTFARIGGTGISLIGAGYLNVHHNNVDMVGEVHSGYGIQVYLLGGISELGHTRHGGAFLRNTVANTAGNNPFIFGTACADTSAHTGGKLLFDATDQDYGPNVGSISYGAQFSNLIEAARGVKSVAVSTTLTNRDRFVRTTATATLTLPDARFCKGQTITLKNASTAATLTVSPTGSQTIDGLSSISTTVVDGVYRVESDGANWLLK
jgi:parallel beta-helix repeat protein